MARLTILRGISGSGKSTWARSFPGKIVVSRDDLRATFFPNFTPEQYYASPILSDMEDSITRIQDAAIVAALAGGRDVIVDDTNIEWKYVKRLAEIGFKAGVEVDVQTFDVPLHVALNRNASRWNAGGRFVPADVIRRQHSRLQGTKDRTLDSPEPPKPYKGTPGKPKAFLFDLDGTTFHMGNKRSPYAHNVDVDDPDEVVLDIVFRLQESGLLGVAMSGREEITRDLTLKALNDNGIEPEALFMRANKDMRKDSIVKAELFDTYVRDNYDVQFVLDDRDQVVAMWRAMGIKCLQVAEGDF